MQEYPIYDDYHETWYTREEVETLYDKYLQWCSENNHEPEVDDIEYIDENNISHVAYHANLI